MKSFMKSKEENNQQDLFEHRIRLNKGLAWRGAQQRIWVNKGRPIKTEGNYQAKVVNKHVKNLSNRKVHRSSNNRANVHRCVNPIISFADKFAH